METLTHFFSYHWKNGIPIGTRATKQAESCSSISFKVISDPYRKRFSVEKYAAGQFVEVIYDSGLFDFRHLRSEETDAWQKEPLEETEGKIRSLIRNMDERVILIEEAHFRDNECTECRIFSPHGIWIATQKVFYQSQGASFNGAILFDRMDKPVLIKRYCLDEEKALFTTLLSEEWEHGI